MNEFGKLIDAQTLHFERILSGTRDQVWEYLVDYQKRSLWFAGGPTDLVSGGKMELIFRNSQFSKDPEPTPEKYKEYGDGFRSFATILEFEKPELLVIEWEEAIVRFQLVEVSVGQTKLTLTHENLKDDKKYRVGTFAGWHTHLNILVDRMNGNEVRGFWKVHMRLEEEYEKLLD